MNIREMLCRLFHQAHWPVNGHWMCSCGRRWPVRWGQ